MSSFVHFSHRHRINVTESPTGVFEAEISYPVDGKEPKQVTIHPEKLPSIGNWMSIAQQIQHLFTNRNVRYVIKESELKFVPRKGQKIWEVQGQIESKEIGCFIPRKSGAVSYVSNNQIHTEWFNGKKEFPIFSPHKVTCLVETPGGDLAYGDEKGNVYIGRELICRTMNDSVDRIEFLDKKHVLIAYSWTFGIFDLSERRFIQQFPHRFQGVVNQRGEFYREDGNTLLLYRFDPKEGLFVESSILTDIDRAVFLSKSVVLCKQEDKFFLFDLGSPNREKEEICDDSEVLENLTFSSNSRKNIALFGKGLSLIPNFGDLLLKIVRGSKQFESENLGSWGVNAQKSISDGTMCWVTDSRGSGVHFCDESGKTKASLVFKSEGRNPELYHTSFQEIIEVPSGALILKASDRICKLQPIHKNSDSKQPLEQRLMLTPWNIDLYEQFVQRDETQQTKVFTLFAGMIWALSQEEPYEARRFYKQLKKMEGQKDLAAQLFLERAPKFLDPKTRRSIQLDLSPATGGQRLKPDGKPRKRLFVGEGSFSFAESYQQKHSHAKITATELSSDPSESVRKRLRRLESKGVKVQLGLDARNLHREFVGKRFSRVHWNFPFAENRVQQAEVARDVLPNFFWSCSQIQVLGDRVHVTLAQEADDEYWKYRQTENPIVMASSRAGYRLVRKRPFNPERYPGYEHIKTGQTDDPHYLQEGREFIFEKGSISKSPEKAEALCDPTEKRYSVKPIGENPGEKDYYFECSTDEESSDGYESESLGVL